MIPPPSPVFYGPPARARRDTLRRLLWAATPVWSLGFLAWLPSLRAAIGRRTAGSWAWFALFAAATAVQITLLEGPADSGKPGGDPASAKVGGYIIALMAAAAVHGFLAIPPRGARPWARGPVTYLQGFGHRHDDDHVSGPTRPVAGYQGYQQPFPVDQGSYSADQPPPYPMMDRTPYSMNEASYPMDRMSHPVDQAPAADAVPEMDEDAAEVQAGLRELRETLERGEER
jgi:hypothetical protein